VIRAQALAGGYLEDLHGERLGAERLADVEDPRAIAVGIARVVLEAVAEEARAVQHEAIFARNA